MTTKMNLNGTTRKALVAAIAEITGERPIYRKMPICNYDIGDITVTKDGSIIYPDDSDILAVLAEVGFTAKSDDAAEHTENIGLTVSLPEEGVLNDLAMFAFNTLRCIGVRLFDLRKIPKRGSAFRRRISTVI